MQLPAHLRDGLPLTRLLLPLTCPVMAMRAAPEPLKEGTAGTALPIPKPVPQNKPLPGWAPAIGGVSLAVGLLSIGWFLGARPEYGDLAARVDYFNTMFNNDRVFYAFIVDAGLYSVWQALLLSDAQAKYRFVPFFGLCAYLLSGGGSKEQQGGKNA